MKDYKQWLVERFIIERKRFDRSGVYAYTQRAMAYNSNKIEGSTLTPEQTASLFDNGTLPQSDDYYRAKDVEEMNGHFLMFNYMLDTLDEELTPELIKHLHYELKTGVFEDRANGYAIGDYKSYEHREGFAHLVVICLENLVYYNHKCSHHHKLHNNAYVGGNGVAYQRYYDIGKCQHGSNRNSHHYCRLELGCHGKHRAYTQHLHYHRIIL